VEVNIGKRSRMLSRENSRRSRFTLMMSSVQNRAAPKINKATYCTRYHSQQHIHSSSRVTATTRTALSENRMGYLYYLSLKQVHNLFQPRGFIALSLTNSSTSIIHRIGLVVRETCHCTWGISRCDSSGLNALHANPFIGHIRRGPHCSR
jgi:hypothetical protein